MCNPKQSPYKLILLFDCNPCLGLVCLFVVERLQNEQFLFLFIHKVLVEISAFLYANFKYNQSTQFF